MDVTSWLGSRPRWAGHKDGAVMLKRTAQFRTAKRKARQDAFIEALYDVGIISRAAEAAEVGRRTVYDWKAEDPAFADEFLHLLVGTALRKRSS